MVITKYNNSKAMNKMPPSLKLIWTVFAESLMAKSEAKVGFLFGGHDVTTYREEYGIRMEEHGPTDPHNSSSPFIFLEYQRNGQLRRLVIVSYHPEFFGTKSRENLNRDLRKKELDESKTVVWSWRC